MASNNVRLPFQVHCDLEVPRQPRNDDLKQHRNPAKPPPPQLAWQSADSCLDLPLFGHSRHSIIAEPSGAGAGMEQLRSSRLLSPGVRNSDSLRCMTTVLQRFAAVRLPLCSTAPPVLVHRNQSMPQLTAASACSQLWCNVFLVSYSTYMQSGMGSATVVKVAHQQQSIKAAGACCCWSSCMSLMSPFNSNAVLIPTPW
jgi:hypothetical protein